MGIIACKTNPPLFHIVVARYQRNARYLAARSLFKIFLLKPITVYEMFGTNFDPSMFNCLSIERTWPLEHLRFDHACSLLLTPMTFRGNKESSNVHLNVRNISEILY